VVQIIGEEKVLFGSDYPLIPPRRYLKEMKSSGVAEDAIKKILGENAERLLGMSLK
jgi:hypothetical protein